MKAIVIGTGTVGSAVKKALEEKEHEVATVGRNSGDYQADISDPNSLKALFSKVGPSKPWRALQAMFSRHLSNRRPMSNGPTRSRLRAWARSMGSGRLSRSSPTRVPHLDLRCPDG
jgi:hypothetical protein